MQLTKKYVPLHRLKDNLLRPSHWVPSLNVLVGITDCGSNPHRHTIDNYFLINLNKMKKTTTLQKAVFMAYILAGVIFAEYPAIIIPVFLSGIYLCRRGFFGKE